MPVRVRGAHRRPNRRAVRPTGRDRGSVTAELALALPVVVVLLALVLAGGGAVAARLACEDAARAGARAAALGEGAAEVTAAAQEAAGGGARVTVAPSGPWVTVTVSRAVTLGRWATTVRVSGSATARAEP
ncbi:TadE family type IV pilus minor pilin [Cellulomonas marina]|uniref:TadE-like protein n=1 Tax=Cellulomonas marina TaxID=988821 RepID=A0A1I0XI94_9CELL|nr:TadE family type IV pilus minor pilin [Cellulomonas marina]SFB00146.1 TadE-like protein [Cellulomonas marina]